MSATYVNIGAYCTAFDFDSGNSPTNISNNVFIIDSASGRPLTNIGTLTTAGYPALSTTVSNTFTLDDIEFKVWGNTSLLLGGPGRQNWKYLSDTSSSISPTYSETSDVVNQIIIAPDGWSTITQSSINSLGSDNTGFSVTHPVNGKSYHIVNSSNTLMLNWIYTNKVVIPSSFTYTYSSTSVSISGITSSKGLYLFKTTNDKSYLTFSSAVLGITNVGTVSVTTQPTSFYFVVDKQPRVTKLLISDSVNGTPIPNVNVKLVGSNYVVELTSGESDLIGEYYLTDVSPNIGETPAGFPDTISTIFKHVGTNKYLYWNGVVASLGVSALSNFSLKDYWSSGLTSANIVKGMQFKMIDQTGTSNASSSPSTTLLDWYQWRVVNDISLSTSAANNTTVVAVNFSNTFVMGNGQSTRNTGFGSVLSKTTASPTNFEGWALVNLESDKNALVYYRPDPSGGLPKSVGYLSADINGNMYFNILYNQNPINTVSNTWLCYKCTTASGQYCNPENISSSSISFTKLGEITVYTKSSRSLSFGFVNTTLATNTPISIKVFRGDNVATGIPISIDNLPTTWSTTIDNNTYNLSASENPLLFGGNYIVEFSSTSVNVSGNPYSNIFIRNSVYSFAGSTGGGYADGIGTAARFNSPYNITCNPTNGDLFVLEGLNVNQYRVRKIVLSTKAVTTIAGNGTNTSTDGIGTASGFSYPGDMFFDSTNSSIYIPQPDPGAQSIRVLNTTNNAVSTISISNRLPDGGLSNITKLGSSYYVSNLVYNRIDRLDISGSTGTLVFIAGGTDTATPDAYGNYNTGYVDGSGSSVRFSVVRCMIPIPGTSFIYICDSNRIRRLNIIDNSVVTVAGSGTAASVDGTGTSASFNIPIYMSYNPADKTIYIVDNAGGGKIRKLNIDTNVVTTLAGSSSGFINSVNGLSARFNNPFGLVFNNFDTNIYIADKNNNHIRLLS